MMDAPRNTLLIRLIEDTRASARGKDFLIYIYRLVHLRWGLGNKESETAGLISNITLTLNVLPKKGYQIMF